ncbi:serine/threonine protein kinase [Phototrophicus methaneseepsis]|uniref:non-specific serine/threonine protein kinase n=1 Tax=Phototrophicus methaneseepsis TaxID=2710758 RepID=A0A7S8EC17_9CHLR|nr:serine/threonine-protein kinase [Phototrophicus methaneseepsis]QPC84094.1 serine/threonine protein kinase [Phototrophicus methaneseepsis]
MTLIVGEVVDQYKVVDFIGAGAIAEVYRVHNAQGEQVALKILNPSTEDATVLARFQREADVLKQLDHPHIIKIYDQGVYEDRQYIVMQLAEGGCMENTRQALSMSDVGRIITEVALALDYAHTRDILHRDIKLENILFDADGRTLLADFGMARPLMAVSGPTRTGFVVGTPLYMSPEQCKDEPLDKRTDIYALGVLAYKLLTGVFPFYSRLPIAIMKMHIAELAPLITETKPELPPELDDIIQRVMAKQPDDRYQSAGEFANAIRQALGLPPIQFPEPEPTPPEPEEELEEPVQQAQPTPTPLMVLIGGAGVLLIIVLAVILLGAMQSPV